ncbi:MAG: flagellar filament capping protein FliD [Gammaproteobacteria bacterium]|nr:flagellar filament capping protein FliD [Gammaproteobacteria bacterium]
MASIQSLGIGSNLLTSKLLEQLIEAERAPVAKRLDLYEAVADAKISAYGELRSVLSKFDTSLTSLTLPSTFNASRATSSSDSHLTATASSLAVPGNYSVSVTQLAQPHSIASGNYASVNEALGTGVLTFRFGTTAFWLGNEYEGFTVNPDVQSRNITITSANNTLSGIRDAVNAANFGVQASIVDDGNGYRLLFSAKASGKNQGIELVATGASGLRALNYNLASETATLNAVTDTGSTDISSGAGLDTQSRAFRLSYNGTAMEIVVASDPQIDTAEKTLAAVQAALNVQLVDNGFAAGSVIADGADNVLKFRTAATGFGTTLNVQRDGASAALTGSTVLADGFDFSVNNATFSISIDGAPAHAILLNTASANRQETVDLLNLAFIDAGIDDDVTASLNNDNELMLTRTATGTSAGIEITDVDVTGTAGSIELGLTDAVANGLDGFGLNTAEGAVSGSVRMSQTMSAQNAEFSVNGVSVTRSSNLVVGVIPGTTLNLKGVTTGPVTLTIDKDPANMIAKVQTFVDAYNDLKALSNELTKYVPGTDEVGKASLLTGDSTMRFIGAEISRLLRTSVEGLNGSIRTLSDVGITTDQNQGYLLQFDSVKFSKAFTENTSAVLSLFANAGSTTDPQITYISTNSQTKPGSYDLEITRLATVGSYQGAIVDSLSDGNIAIDNDNNEFTIEINDLSVAVTLTNGTYGSAEELAEHIQMQINASQTLLLANQSVSVTYDAAQGRLNISSSLYGSSSRVVFAATDANVADTFGFVLPGQGSFQANQLSGLATATGNSAENFTTPVEINSETSFSITINGESTALIMLHGDADNPQTYNSPDDLITAIKAQIDADPLFLNLDVPEILVSYSYNAQTQLGRLVFSTGSNADTLSVGNTTAGAASKLGLFVGNGAANPSTAGVDVAGKINGLAATGIGQMLVAATGNTPAAPGFYLNTAHGNLSTSTPSDTFRVAVDGIISSNITLGMIGNTDPGAVAIAMQTAINNNPALIAAGVGVVVQYDENSGGFGIISNTTGTTSKVQIVDLQGNASAIFGFTAGAGALGRTGTNASGEPDDASGIRVRVTGGALGKRGSVSFVRGVADRLATLMDSYLGNNGLLSNRTDALNKELAVIAEKRVALDARIARSEERLRSSFLANDLIISRFNTTADFLSSQLRMLEDLASNTVNKK